MMTTMMTTIMTGCTYAVTMVHTEGETTDVVDETASATPTTSVTIPAI